MAKAKQEESIEKQLWKAADKLRKNIDAAEYKHVVMGLVFLKYISDSFEELYISLKTQVEMGADPEDRDEYKAENVFFVPPIARWSFLLSNAKLPNIGKIVDEAMDAIEKENSSLRGVLPKVFALAEGKQGGQFYTPKSVVELLVKMLEPYKGRVFDPCCGSGGMFVQSEKFVTEHQGKINDISVFGQESNQTTWRLAKMNLAIRGIDSSQVKWNNEGSFLNDAHKDLKADFIIANPPFNVSDWSGELLRNDGRWKYGTPPEGNANYAWIQHFFYHLAPTGAAGFVLAKGSLTSNTSNEGEIRKALIEANLIDCIVNLPAKLFLNTGIPASIWFMKRGRTTKDILFIDSRNMGELINRRTKEFSSDDTDYIASVYHNWKNAKAYEDIKGFCKSASLKEVRELSYVLTPGRYVGLEVVDDEFDFKERFYELQKELQEQMKQEQELNKRINENLAKVVVDE